MYAHNQEVIVVVFLPDVATRTLVGFRHDAVLIPVNIPLQCGSKQFGVTVLQFFIPMKHNIETTDFASVPMQTKSKPR